MQKPSNLYELVELPHDLPESRLSNADISPTKIAERTWNYWHIAALWVGMSVCVPTYMLAASMISAFVRSNCIGFSSASGIYRKYARSKG